VFAEHLVYTKFLSVTKGDVASMTRALAIDLAEEKLDC
jgi:hypothetical protein